MAMATASSRRSRPARRAARVVGERVGAGVVAPSFAARPGERDGAVGEHERGVARGPGAGAAEARVEIERATERAQRAARQRREIEPQAAREERGGEGAR